MDHKSRQAAIDIAGRLAIDGFFDEALDLLDQVQPDDVSAWMQRGKIHFQQGRFDGAAKAWQRVLQLDAGHADARASLARLADVRRTFFGRAAAYSAQYLFAVTTAAGGIVAACATALFIWSGARGTAIADTDKRPSPRQSASVQERLDTLETAVRDLVRTASSAAASARETGPLMTENLAPQKTPPETAAQSALDQFRQRLDKLEQDHATLLEELGANYQRLQTLDNVARRHEDQWLGLQLDAFDNRAADYEWFADQGRRIDRMDQILQNSADREELRSFDRNLAQLRNRVLVWRSSDLARRANLSEKERRSLRMLVDEMKSLKFDEATVTYALEVEAWLDARPAVRRPTRP